MPEPSSGGFPERDRERYPGEVHWYDLPDDDAAPEDEELTAGRPAPARWRLSRVLTVLSAWRGMS